MSEALLSCSNLRYRYPGGAVAVTDLNLAVSGGEILVVAGANGSGKTTFLRLLARVLEPDSGVVTFERRPLASWSRKEYARRIGYLPQSIDTAEPLRAIDVVSSGRAHLGGTFFLDRSESTGSLEALDLCDASHLRDRYLHEMSGGERQRVFLARLLAADPDLLLLDEPFASLDLAHVAGTAAILRKLAQAGGKTIVVVSHDLNWSAAIADRLVVMREGGIVAAGPVREVMEEAVIETAFGYRPGVAVGEAGERWIVPRLPRP